MDQRTLGSLGIGALSHLTLHVRVCAGAQTSSSTELEAYVARERRISKPSRRACDPNNAVLPTTRGARSGEQAKSSTADKGKAKDTIGGSGMPISIAVMRVTD